MTNALKRFAAILILVSTASACGSTTSPADGGGTGGSGGGNGGAGGAPDTECLQQAGCCRGDLDCASDQECVDNTLSCTSTPTGHQGVCKPRPTAANTCWQNGDCSPGSTCTGATVCPCGASCIVADAVGTCANAAAPPGSVSPL